MAQSVSRLTQEPEVPGSPFGPATYFLIPLIQEGQLSVTGESMGNRQGGLRLPRKRVVRLTGRLVMASDVYRGRKTTTTTQQQ